MQVKSIAECSFIKLPFVIKIFVLSILVWPFYTGFTVYCGYSKEPAQLDSYLLTLLYAPRWKGLFLTWLNHKVICCYLKNIS